MASEHDKYLAANVLNENSNVTYRSFSHHFKIHANKAKQILEDFHRTQNARQAGSVHATYFVTGLKEVSHDTPTKAPDADGDIAMPSSPGVSSSMPVPEDEPHPLTKVLTLARQEDLEVVKAGYSKIMTVHVYSLSPAPLKDLEVLSTVTQQINQRHASEDPLIYYKQYGVIQNPDVRRRTAPKKGVAAVPVEAASAFPSKAKAAAKPEYHAQQQTTKAEPQPAAKAEPKKAAKPGTLKKEDSDLFKSFAKAKPKPPPKPDPTADVPMTGDSESEEEEVKAQAARTSTKRKEERESRQQRLQAMMDEDDEPMEDADTPADEEDQSEPEPGPEPEPEPPVKEEPEPEPEPAVTVSNGRRRGKRRVTKKKTMKDEEGYLITKEEQVWESFSEDEPPPPAQKPKPSAKPKGSTGKGQGSIMSFFGKK